MHQQYGNRQFLMAILAILIILCVSFTTQTPQSLVILAGFMVVIGIFGWFYSKDLPLPWLIRLAATVLVGLGVAFLIWYFHIGYTLLHPILDMQKHLDR